MTVTDKGSTYIVRLSADDVVKFKSEWPCSGLPDKPLWFEFSKRNGDLVDMSPDSEKFDGPALVALSGDAQTYGEAQLKTKPSWIPSKP